VRPLRVPTREVPPRARCVARIACRWHPQKEPLHAFCDEAPADPASTIRAPPARSSRSSESAELDDSSWCARGEGSPSAMAPSRRWIPFRSWCAPARSWACSGRTGPARPPRRPFCRASSVPRWRGPHRGSTSLGGRRPGKAPTWSRAPGPRAVRAALGPGQSVFMAHFPAWQRTPSVRPARPPRLSPAFPSGLTNGSRPSRGDEATPQPCRRHPARPRRHPARRADGGRRSPDCSAAQARGRAAWHRRGGARHPGRIRRRRPASPVLGRAKGATLRARPRRPWFAGSSPSTGWRR